VRSTRRVWSASLLVTLVLATTTIMSADTNQNAFKKNWVGRRVVVKGTLYSLVYKERSLRGSIHSSRDGLTVVTPFAGAYFQFDGRHHVDDVMQHDVQKIAEAVRRAYVKDNLIGEGSIQDIDPVMLARYDRGVELVVSAAQVNRDTVRLKLSLPADGDDDVVTWLTVLWPSPLSKSFSERGNVEDLIQQFLTLVE
jgi:hypothetical protein